MFLKVINRRLLRDFEQQDYGYPGEGGLLPAYLIKFKHNDEQVRQLTLF